jgi:ParB family chromosome partitioning protein
METVIMKIPVGKIEFTTDRTHGGEGNIDILAQSIKAIGIIHPPAVKELADKKGHYRIIAGRRRFAAVKSLGWKNVEVIVHPKNADDEAIALAENVNREDMHPLDEAEKFKREIDSGKTVEEVAKYYARSVSGIHQRVRLTNLIDGVKTMFRDGKINLSGAALIASLPEEDQEKFLKKYGEKKADKWEINNFIGSVQRLKIKHIADNKCAKCKKRTFISTPGLFEDYSGLEDVCFDSECYAGKWKNLIAKLIAEQTGNTDSKIILNRGIPDFLPKKTKMMTIGDVEYTLLSQSDHSWNETKKKSAANTAWLISLEWFQSSGSYDVKAVRVEYEVCKKQNYRTSSSSSEVKDPVKTFMIDLLPDIQSEEKKSVAEIMQKKHEYPYGFFRAVRERLMETIVDRRLHEEDKENMATLYLASELGGRDSEGNWHEIDPDYQGLFDLVFEKKFELSQLPIEPWVEKIFRLLIAISVEINELPELRSTEAEWKQAENTLFWRFAQITKEDYIALYQRILTEAIRVEINSPAKQDDGSQEDETDTDMEDPLGDA